MIGTRIAKVRQSSPSILRRERVRGEAGRGQPDDGELECRRSGFRPEKMGSWRAGRMTLRWIVRERSSRRIPRTGDELDPSNE
jgi:hypothetical protein